MLTTTEAFDRFRQRLELGETEQKDAARRQKEVRECIREAFDLVRDFLSGSYSRHTKTKPLKDVDVIFVLGPKERWRRDEPPLKILQAFEECLKKTFTEVAIGRRSVTVEFEKSYYADDHEGKVLSIDAVPAFESSPGEYEIPDNQTGTWIKTNPDKHKEQSTAKNKELNGRWVPSREDGKRVESCQWQAGQTILLDRGYGRATRRGAVFELSRRSSEPLCGYGSHDRGCLG